MINSWYLSTTQQVYAQLVKQQQTKEVNEEEDEAKEEMIDDEDEEEKAEVDNKISEKERQSSTRIKRGDSRSSGRKSPSKRLMSQMSVKSETSENQVCQIIVALMLLRAARPNCSARKLLATVCCV